MQNFNKFTLNNTSNRIYESGIDNKLRSKRKHFQLINHDQQCFPLIKKMKLNTQIPHFQSNFKYNNYNIYMNNDKRIPEQFYIREANYKESGLIINNNNFKSIFKIIIFKLFEFFNFS